MFRSTPRGPQDVENGASFIIFDLLRLAARALGTQKLFQILLGALESLLGPIQLYAHLGLALLGFLERVLEFFRSLSKLLGLGGKGLDLGHPKRVIPPEFQQSIDHGLTEIVVAELDVAASCSAWEHCLGVGEEDLVG